MEKLPKNVDKCKIIINYLDPQAIKIHIELKKYRLRSSKKKKCINFRAQIISFNWSLMSINRPSSSLI